MKHIDDVWKDISSLPSLHHPTTNLHFQDFFTPATRPGGGVLNTHFTTPPHPPPATTILSLSTSSNHHHEEPNKRHKSTSQPPNPPPPPPPTSHYPSPPESRSSGEYSEKFKRLMKNRESAARSRARKQARADELEIEVQRLAKENAKLKRLQKELSIASAAQPPKKSRLYRTKSAPF